VARQRVAAAALAAWVVMTGVTAAFVAAETPPAGGVRSVQVELPGQEHNAVKTSWPGILVWGFDAETIKG